MGGVLSTDRLAADLLHDASLTLEDRMTLTNMAIEAGGKNGVCDVDEKTLQYVRARSNRPMRAYRRFGANGFSRIA